jgi:hypothetical protein
MQVCEALVVGSAGMYFVGNHDRAMILSVSRIYALGHYYRSPYDVIYHFQYDEVPRLLRAAGHEPIPPPEEYREGRAKEGYHDEWDYTVTSYGDR